MIVFRTRWISVLLLPAITLGCTRSAPPVSAPASVVVTPVERRDVPVMLDATGTVEPIQSAAVAAQVDGIIEQVLFREGDDVTAGQLLFQLDAHPYTSALTTAQAELARDQVESEKAETDLRRVADLAAKQYASTQEADDARAIAMGLRATLQADSGAVARARINLDRASVRAPIAGRAGALLVRAGNLVRATSGTPLVQINQIAPILIRFAVPATQLPAIRRAGTGLSVRAVPVGDSVAVSEGKLVFLDNAVDSLSGTILLKARFDNQTHALWPGALVRVTLRVSVESNALVVPVTAVLTGQQGASVFVLDDSGKVHLKKVTVGYTNDSLIVLTSGVAAGEQVVTAGQVRLVDGAKAQPVKAAP
jgi:multidrug efflux system membrane fusion protein